MSIKAKIAAELAERVKGGDSLAMDFASKMQRAKEQGFDTDTVYYHGTNIDRDVILDQGFNTSDRSLSSDQIPHPRGDNIGTFFSQSKGDAKDFGRNIFQTYLSLKNPKVFKTQSDWKDFNRENSGVTPDIRDSDGYIIEEGTFQHKAREVLEGQGYDGVVIEKPNYVKGRGKPWAVAFEPNQIRSTNAAFDPAKKDSSNLLASAGAGIGALGLMGASDDSEASNLNLSQLLSMQGEPLNRDTIQGASTQGILGALSPIADAIEFADENVSGPASMLIPTGTSDYIRKLQYGDNIGYLDRLFANPLL